MTHSYLFALLIVAIAVGTGRANDRPGSIDSRPDFESIPIEPSFARTEISGALVFGPVNETTDVVDPFGGTGDASGPSSEQKTRQTNEAYRSVKEWLQGDGYAAVDEQPGEFWRGTRGCEAFPLVTTRASQFDWPLLTPVTFRNPQGEEVTFSPGVTPAEVIKLIQPLPDCVHKLLRLDRSQETAGIRHALESAGNFNELETYWDSNYFGVPRDDFVVVSSKLFPEHLFRLHFEGYISPVLKRVQLVNASHLSWLRRAHGENPWPQSVVYPSDDHRYPSDYTIIRSIIDAPRPDFYYFFQVFPVLE